MKPAETVFFLCVVIVCAFLNVRTRAGQALWWVFLAVLATGAIVWLWIMPEVMP